MISREKEQEMFDMATNYMALYGVNINMARAIPFIRDGLKPITRRLLYAAYKFHGENWVKASVLKGDVGKFSPHGEQEMNEIMAKTCQTFSNNIPLLDGHGNVGNVTTGDDFAADRYYSVKLSKFSMDILFKEFDGKVNMVPSYDDTSEEPFTLPARFQVILLNGTAGIAYTLSCNIPPYNLGEIVDATIKVINFDKEFRKAAYLYTKKHKNEVSEYLSYSPNVYNVMLVDPKIIKELGLKKPRIHLVPDSPTGCNIYIRDHERFTMESVYEIDNVNYTITIFNTPYLKYIDKIDSALRAIQDSDEKIPEILSAEEDSDDLEKEMRYVIRCKPCNVQNIVNKLFKRIPGFRAGLSASNITVIDSTYHTRNFNPEQILGDWITQRFDDKRTWFLRELVAKTAQLNMLEGIAYMLNDKNRDRTVKVISSSKNKSAIIESLVKEYKGKVTSSQASYIGELKFYRITREEYEKTCKEIKKVGEEIDKIKKATENDDTIKDIIIDELLEIKGTHGCPRKSRIISSSMSEEAAAVGTVHILPDGNVIFAETTDLTTISSDIKPLNSELVCLLDKTGQYVWVDTREIRHNAPTALLSIANSKMYDCVTAVSNPSNCLMMLTNFGRIKSTPISSLKGKKKKVYQLATLDFNEVIVSAMEVQNNSDDLLIYTKDGLGKRIKISDILVSVTGNGRMINKEPIENVSGMFILKDNKPLICYVTTLGRVRVNHAKYLSTGKKYANFKPLIELSPREDLIGVFCCDDNQTITLHLDNGKEVNVSISSLGISTINTPPVRAKGLSGAIKVIRASIT